MSENRGPYAADVEARLAAEIQKRGRLLGGGVSVALLAAAVERLQGELAEARAEVERVRDQERRATVKYLEQQADLARAFKPDVARVLQVTAYDSLRAFTESDTRV